MSLWSRLFGGSGGGGPSQASAEPEHYKEYRIYVAPVRDGSSYRVSARIEKEIGGEVKSHLLIRADTLESAEAAAEMSLRKARNLIDEQGEAIFG